MAAAEYFRACRRSFRSARVHLDCDPLARNMAAASGRMADSCGDDPHSQQLCAEPASSSVRDQPGNLVLSAVRNNIFVDPSGAPETELNLLKTVVGPDIGDKKLRALVARFGSAANLHFADVEAVTDVLDDHNMAIRLKSILRIAAEIGKPAVINHPVIKDCADLLYYLQNAMGKSRVETFRVLFLDAHNQIIEDEVLWSGTVSEVQVHPREIIRRVLELDASAFIAAHNHPSRVVLPSRADVEMTRKLLIAADALGIAFHDHFIVAPNNYHSMRYHKSVDPWGR